MTTYHATINIPNISPQDVKHAQHLINNDLKYRDWSVEVIKIKE